MSHWTSTGKDEHAEVCKEIDVIEEIEEIERIPSTSVLRPSTFDHKT